MTPKLEFNLIMPCSTVFSRRQLMKVQTQVTVCPPALRWSSLSLQAPPPAHRPAQVCHLTGGFLARAFCLLTSGGFF